MHLAYLAAISIKAVIAAIRKAYKGGEMTDQIGTLTQRRKLR